MSNVIILKGPPKSTQSIYGLSCRGKFATRYMTAKGKSIKEDYQWQTKSQWKQPIIEGSVAIWVRLYFGTKRRQDIDNFNKILYDALSGIVWADDSQITFVMTEKLYDKKNPRIEVELL